jgi:ubiquinone/menaquinone biosynthesis C-methylase UbiE
MFRSAGNPGIAFNRTTINRMNRILEPEIMEGREQAVAYAAADFSISNQWYVDALVARHGDSLRSVIDIGCGPADVMIRLARRSPDVAITAVDGSAEMLRLAAERVEEAALAGRITLLQGIIPGLPLPERSFDAILSKDLLHHLPEPDALWSEARRLARPGAAIFVMDLMRPETPEAARRIVADVAAEADAILKEDFFNSLCAAFTVEEVRRQIAAAGLALEVEQAGERHLVVSGVA